MTQHYLIPLQYTGEEKDLRHTLSAADISDAEDWFVEAKDRLWRINRWADYCPGIGLSFKLTDSHGHPVNHWARKRDHIIITSGEGQSAAKDWVVIEAVEYDDYPDENKETFALHLRPAVQPVSLSSLYKDGHVATSTIVVERISKMLVVSYHGRNESFEHPDSNRADSTGWLGLSEQQWRLLLEGIGGTTT